MTEDSTVITIAASVAFLGRVVRITRESFPGGASDDFRFELVWGRPFGADVRIYDERILGEACDMIHDITGEDFVMMWGESGAQRDNSLSFEAG